MLTFINGVIEEVYFIIFNESIFPEIIFCI